MAAPRAPELAMNLRTVFKAAAAVALVGAYQHIRRRRSARGQAQIHILGYHRVVDRVFEDRPILPSLCVSADTFRRQMEQVKRTFRVLSLADAVRAVTGELQLDRDACTITFDDGYRDLYLRAAPILADLAMPATVFVPTGFVGSQRHLTHDRLYAALWKLHRGNLSHLVDALIARLPADELLRVTEALEVRGNGALRLDDGARVLDESELRALSAAGWEIGAHTIDHTVLTYESPERAAEQLWRPKADLESITGRPCRFFAWCNGYHSPPLVRALEQHGYRAAVTTCDHPNRRGEDRFRLGRKVLWEGHARGALGRWSPAISAANLHDLFGALGLTRPTDGEVRCVA
jgi:peptidoglycan/xylan/chitin deacetylase (PgdA/CDA1 family)